MAAKKPSPDEGARTAVQTAAARPPERGAAVPLDLRALNVFVAVVEAGGMTTAARRLGMTQPAVSQTIAALERTLGVSLFDRSLRPPTVTLSGSILYEQAEQLLARARAMTEMVRRPAHAGLPHIRLGLIDSFAAIVGPHLIKEVRSAALHWSVWSGLSPSHERALMERQVDIVVCGDTLEDTEQILRYDLLTEPFFLAVPAVYDGDVSSLAALAQRLDLVRYSSRSLIGKQVERHLRRVRVEAPRRLEFDGADAVHAMVAAGVGWALTTPLCFLQGRIYTPGVRFLPLPGPGFSRRLILAARRDELGDLPARVAATGQRILRRDALPLIIRELPWLAGRITVGGARAQRQPAEAAE